MRMGLLTWLHHLPGWKTSIPARLAWIFLAGIGFLAVFGPLIANEKPYYCKLEGKTYFPLFSNLTESRLSTLHPAASPVDWHTTSFDAVWRTPVTYSHTTIDLKTGTGVAPWGAQPVPSRQRHWLGTDTIGRDVMAGMIRGCRVSLLIGLGSMLLALCIGVMLGSLAAYYGNRELKMSWLQTVAIFIFFLVFVWVWYFPWSFWLRLAASLILLGSGIFLSLQFEKYGHRRIPFPVDSLVTGGISIVDGFPAMFLILILIALLPFKGWIVVMLVIALLRWPAMARYMRAEVLKMKETNYIKAAQLINLPSWKIIIAHIIPYAFRPVMISFIFGVATAILAESSLSFLGIGLPTEEINWGRLLAQSRNHFDAWWLVVFPGSAIFLTLLSLFTIGNVWEKNIASSH